DSRRRQDVGVARSAPPRDPVGKRRNRGALGRPGDQRNPRPHGGPAMIQPTLRAFTVFAIGVPLALFLVIYEPALWPWSLDYGALVLIAIATDAALAFRPKLLEVTTVLPDSLQVGERGTITVGLA